MFQIRRRKSALTAPLLLALRLPQPVQALFFGDLFATLYFLFGALLRNRVQPHCDAGVAALQIDDEVLDCSCLAAESDDERFLLVFPVWQGAVTCRSSAEFGPTAPCLLSENDSNSELFCGGAAVGDTFRRDGSFARLESELFAYFLVNSYLRDDDNNNNNAENPEMAPFEIAIQAVKATATTTTTSPLALTSCTAFVDFNSRPCANCDICADGISFTADCSNIVVGKDNDLRAPNLTDRCRNFAFQLA